MNKKTATAITAPYALWMAVFIVVPLLIVAYYALTDSSGAFSLENISNLSLIRILSSALSGSACLPPFFLWW